MTTYSISLDDVELALLPLRTHSYNNFLKKEHFQFAVMTEPVSEPSPEINYTCHICAIDLPAAFAREHAASIKHRANVRIAIVATQRTHKLIAALPPPHTTRSTARFCTNCAAVADEDHDKTKEHKIAVMHDNLLWELMKAYVGDDETNDDQNTDNSKMFNGYQNRSKSVDRNVDNDGAMIACAVNNQPNQTKFISQNTESKDGRFAANSDSNLVTHGQEDINKVGNNNTAKTQLRLNLTSTPTTTSRWVKLPETKNETEHEKSQNPKPTVSNTVTNGVITEVAKEPYENELRKFMETENQFQIKDIYDRVHIKINEDKVNVFSDHFHSFHRVFNSDNVECIVCNCIFNDKDLEAHKYNLNHMSGVAKLGKDGNYVRELNETHSHCILCNQKINNINVIKHTTSHHHTLRKKKNVTSNASKAKDNNDVENNKVKTNPTNTGIETSTNESVEINKHPYKLISGELRCVVCDCKVPGDLRNRKDHLKGLRHTNNLKAK